MIVCEMGHQAPGDPESYIKHQGTLNVTPSNNKAPCESCIKHPGTQDLVVGTEIVSAHLGVTTTPSNCHYFVFSSVAVIRQVTV